MTDLLGFLVVVAVCVALIYAASRYIGNGVCRTCGKLCPPWSMYCWRHNPFYTPQDDQEDEQ